MNDIDLKGKIAIVTGGASGLGLATAERLRQSGARVTVWDRARLQGPEAAEVDISDLQSVESAAQQVWNQHGRIDILVNSAGILGTFGPTASYAPEEWNRIIAVNLTGVFHCCRTILPFMTQNQYGRIVNVSSAGAKDGHPQMAAYVAAKAGVIGFSKSLGKEVARQGVIVNCITPGIMDTPMGNPDADKMDPAARQRLIDAIPVGRIAGPAEIAAMIAWLVSDECGYSAGATFDASGGRTDY